jgi:hypothetical protein
MGRQHIIPEPVSSARHLEGIMSCTVFVNLKNLLCAVRLFESIDRRLTNMDSLQGPRLATDVVTNSHYFNVSMTGCR